MSDLSVSKIGSIDVYTIKNVLLSPKLTEIEKAKFIRTNKSEINAVLKVKLDSDEYNLLMDNRPLIRFRPLKNSFTKRGDKVLLAQSLGLPTPRLDSYIESVANSLRKVDGLEFVTPDQIKSIQTYVYRHGTINQLVTFLDYELANSKNMVKTLQKTLQYNNGGMADYFIRPIHRMSNKSLIKIYSVIDKNLMRAQQSGSIKESEAMAASHWALQQIYQLQYNSKLINAIKTYNI